MSDYQQSDVIGTRWIRANRINIDNPLNGEPTITFAEEEVIDVGDTVVTNLVSSITIPFAAEDVIPIRNPATWELTGNTITGGEIYAILASAYWKAALERDGT